MSAILVAVEAAAMTAGPGAGPGFVGIPMEETIWKPSFNTKFFSFKNWLAKKTAIRKILKKSEELLL